MTLSNPRGEVIEIASRKCAELLAFLALRRNTRVDRETVADALWPDCDPIIARNRLKQVLARLRAEVGDLPVVSHGKHELEMSRDFVEVDFHRLERRLKWLRTLSIQNRSDAVRQILETSRLGLLPGLTAEWIALERRKYEKVTRDLEGELEPQEEARPPQFRFGDELGLLNVPLAARANEVAEARHWLAGTQPRALYIVGAPGVGKTRLLAEVLADCGEVCDAVISLSTVQSSEIPWQERLAQAIGASSREQLTSGLIQLLNDFRRPLVAVDDVDQADDAMTEWVGQILFAVPRLRMIGTARQMPSDVLAKIIEVRPLESESGDESDAVNLLKLFAANAGLSESAIQASRQPLREIAEYLDGLPLALEVAAGWLPFMDAESLLAKLRADSGLVVRTAARGRLSLVSCLTSICRSLSPAERRALLLLSLCKGGCGPELAEEMLGPDWPWLIRSLSDRSLLLQVQDFRGVRFLVLQALRQGMRVISTEAETEAGEARHNAACVKLGSKAVWEINEGDRKCWLQWLRSEGDNLLLACERSLEQAAMAKSEWPEASWEMLHLGSAFWLIGQPSKYSRIAQRAYKTWGPDNQPINARTPVTIVRTWVRQLVKEERFEKALEVSTSFREGVEALRDANRTVAALEFEGEVRYAVMDYAGAFQCFDQATSVYVQLGRPRQGLWLQAKMALIELDEGRIEASDRRKRRAFETACELGDHNSEGMYAKEFAKAAIGRKEWAEARSLAERSVEAFLRAGEYLTTFQARLVLAAALIGSKENSLAADVLDQAEGDALFIEGPRLSDLLALREAAQNPAASELVDLTKIDIY